MASLGQTFDSTQYDTEQRDYSELPNGIYALEVEGSEVTQTKSGSGTILKTTMSVIEPEDLKGRKLFTTYNLENQNETAQRIGQAQFASLCRAIGIQSVDDSEQLHFIRFVAKVGLGKPSKDGQYPARAEIKAYYFPDQGNVPEPAIDAVQPAAQPTAANDNRRPAANDNAPAARPAAAATGARPWGQRK